MSHDFNTGHKSPVQMTTLAVLLQLLQLQLLQQPDSLLLCRLFLRRLQEETVESLINQPLIGAITTEAKRGRTLALEGGAGGERASPSGPERWPASQMDPSSSGSFPFLWPSFHLPAD